MGVSKVSRKGLTNIPSKVRREAGIEEGDLMVWEVEGREVIRVRIVKDPLKHLKGKYDDPDLTYDRVEETTDRLIEREMDAGN